MQFWALLQLQGTALRIQHEPADEGYQQSVGMSLRQMPHEAVDPDEYLHISNGQRRGDKPGDPFLLCDFTSQDLLSEADDGPSGDEKAEVEAGTQAKKHLVFWKVTDCPGQRSDRYEGIECQQ